MKKLILAFWLAVVFALPSRYATAQQTLHETSIRLVELVTTALLTNRCDRR